MILNFQTIVLLVMSTNTTLVIPKIDVMAQIPVPLDLIQPGGVIPGICSASSYNGSDPNSACISGGHYKQCCSNPDPGYTPTTYCSSGVCPAGFKTSPLDTTCDTPITCSTGTTYNQCGQTGGCTNSYASNHTIKITPNNCSDGTTTYSCSDLGVFACQCGNACATRTPANDALDSMEESNDYVFQEVLGLSVDEMNELIIENVLY